MMVQSKPQHKACPRRTEFTAVNLAADKKKRKKEKTGSSNLLFSLPQN